MAWFGTARAVFCLLQLFFFSNWPLQNVEAQGCYLQLESRIGRGYHSGNVMLWHKGFVLQGRDGWKQHMIIYPGRLGGLKGVSCNISDINQYFPCTGDIRSSVGHLLCFRQCCLFTVETHLEGHVGHYVFPVAQEGHDKPNISFQYWLADRQRDYEVNVRRAVMTFYKESKPNCEFFIDSVFEWTLGKIRCIKQNQTKHPYLNTLTITNVSAPGDCVSLRYLGDLQHEFSLLDTVSFRDEGSYKDMRLSKQNGESYLICEM
eukprot:Lankesteria_metandrocarpae@DN2712_c0_g2_i1.p1